MHACVCNHPPTWPWTNLREMSSSPSICHSLPALAELVFFFSRLRISLASCSKNSATFPFSSTNFLMSSSSIVVSTALSFTSPVLIITTFPFSCTPVAVVFISCEWQSDNNASTYSNHKSSNCSCLNETLPGNNNTKSTIIQHLSIT